MAKSKFKIGDTVGFTDKTPQWFQQDYSSSATGKIVRLEGRTYVIKMNGIGNEIVYFPSSHIK